jgi:hypothetical protein
MCYTQIFGSGLQGLSTFRVVRQSSHVKSCRRNRLTGSRWDSAGALRVNTTGVQGTDWLLPRELSKPEVKPIKYIGFSIFCNAPAEWTTTLKLLREVLPRTKLPRAAIQTLGVFRRKKWITSANKRDESYAKLSLQHTPERFLTP